MRDRSLGALLIPLLAMLTITLPVLGRSARTTAPTQGLATSPSTAVPGSESGPAQASTPRTAGASALLRAFGEGQVRASRRIVATVPDPIDAANVAYTFDRYVDAIQRAMEAANYTLDRFDLPWRDGDAAASAMAVTEGFQDSTSAPAGAVGLAHQPAGRAAGG